jgi:hypothetical protein
MKPQRLVMSMAPNKSYLQGYNTALDATEDHHKELEMMLRKVLSATQPKVDTPEEAVLRCNAFALLDDVNAMREERARHASLFPNRATDYDVDMDKEREAQ